MDTKEETISDSFRSISGLSKGIYKDNGSKFLSFAYPVEDESEIKSIITAIKKEYYDARHHCYAYRLGYTGERWRVNDDGEPSSSAGKPILGQILSKNLSDILIVVVRYFGGVKLGIPGLIKAYKTASSDALDSADIIEKVATRDFVVKYEYLQMNAVMKILKDLDISVVSQTFDTECEICVKVRLSLTERFFKEVQGIDRVEVVENTTINKDNI